MADTPPPAPLPPDLAEALRQGNPLRLIRALLATASTPAPGRPGREPAAGPIGKTATRRRPDLSPELPPIAASGLSPGEVPRSESLVWVWVVVLLLAYLAYRYWLA